MKAIILDTTLGPATMSHTKLQAGLTTKIVNKSLLEHHIERVASAGIEDVIVLTDKQLPDTLTNGRRWNINLDIKQQLSILDLEGQDSFLIISEKFLTNLDLKIFLDKAGEIDDMIIAAQPLSRPGNNNRSSFYPVILKTDYMRKEQLFFTGSPARLGLLLLEVSFHAKKIDLLYNVFSLEDHIDYWMTSRALLDRKSIPGGLSGFPLSSDLWVNVDTRVNPDVSINGFALIGKNSKIHSGVTFNGFVIIGDNVVIDKRAIITDSIIHDNTYVGTDINIENSIVSQSSVYKVDKKVGLEVDESFILGQTWPGKRVFASLMSWINI